MAQTRYTRFVNGRRTRICFKKIVRIKLPQKTPSKDTMNAMPQKIELYPNYQFILGEVEPSSKKPQNDHVYAINHKIDLEFDSKCIFLASEDEDEKTKQQLNNMSKSVVQVHFFYQLGEWKRSSGTGILIKCNNRHMVLTCLHIFQLNSKKKSIESFIVITNSEADKCSRFDSYIEDYVNENSSPKKENESPFQTFRDFLGEKKEPFYEVEMDRNFLRFRKEWLEDIKSQKDFDIVLDPLSKLKPSPSVDISILEVPNADDDFFFDNQFYELDGNKNIISSK